jgi:hypothetical protein
VLTLLEEVALLTVDSSTGQLRGDHPFSVRYALVGAALFDLALAGRIDTDADTILVIDDAPTGAAIQDELLADLSGRGGRCGVREWVEQTFRQGQDLESRTLALLIDRGLIRLETTTRLWVIDERRFPVLNNRPRQRVKWRLAWAVLTEEIPEVRDIMLVSLANACGLLSTALTADQIAARAERIDTLSRIETISRDVGTAITALFQDMGRGLPRSF